MSRYLSVLLMAFVIMMPSVSYAASASSQPESKAVSAERDDGDVRKVNKVLFLGDSMTGWLAERLNAYGKLNGFEVATVVWDGSTILKWAASPRLASIISAQKPDAIFISLGMNELFEKNPEKRFSAPVSKILHAAGDVPVIWIGPPSWPGHDKGEALNVWLGEKLGDGHFFRSSDLALPRQSKSNPHPTRQGMIKWMDSVVEWLGDSDVVRLEQSHKPGATQMSRGNIFIYKRMKETL